LEKLADWARFGRIGDSVYAKTATRDQRQGGPVDERVIRRFRQGEGLHEVLPAEEVNEQHGRQQADFCGAPPPRAEAQGRPQRRKTKRSQHIFVSPRAVWRVMPSAE
jgi:hypothetical protein